MRYLILIILTLIFSRISGQDIKHTEEYLKFKYRYSDTITSGQIQYIDKSVELYKDTLISKYFNDYNFYIAKFKGLICWTPDYFNAYLIQSKITGNYFILEPIDRSEPDSITIGIFENRIIDKDDKIVYCELVSKIFVRIGNAKPRISEPIIISNNSIQVKYYNEYTNDKLWRLINFHFLENGCLKEVFIINPKSSFNYKDQKRLKL